MKTFLYFKIYEWKNILKVKTEFDPFQFCAKVASRACADFWPSRPCRYTITFKYGLGLNNSDRWYIICDSSRVVLVPLFSSEYVNTSKYSEKYLLLLTWFEKHFIALHPSKFKYFQVLPVKQIRLISCIFYSYEKILSTSFK